MALLILFVILLQISEDDVLPKHLCAQCLNNLTLFYEFIKKFQKSEEILQTSLKCQKNKIELNECVNEIKIEEHDVTLEYEIKTEDVTVKQEYVEEIVDITEEDPNDSSECKYFLCLFSSETGLQTTVVLCTFRKNNF